MNKLRELASRWHRLDADLSSRMCAEELTQALDAEAPRLTRWACYLPGVGYLTFRSSSKTSASAEPNPRGIYNHLDQAERRCIVVAHPGVKNYFFIQDTKHLYADVEIRRVTVAITYDPSVSKWANNES